MRRYGTMGKFGLTLGQKRPNFGAKRAQLQKPAIHSKQLPVKCPKNNTGFISWIVSNLFSRGKIIFPKIEILEMNFSEKLKRIFETFRLFKL